MQPCNGCRQIFRGDTGISQLPPPPLVQIQPWEAIPKGGLQELQDLVQSLREECLAAFKQQEEALSRLHEHQDSFKTKVLEHHETLAEQWTMGEAPAAAPDTSKEEAAITVALPEPAREEAKDDAKADNTDPHHEPAPPPLTLHMQLRQVVNGKYFDILMGVLIALNVVMMFVELEKKGYHMAVNLKLRTDTGTWDRPSDVLEGFDHFFNAAFFLELLFRYIVDFSASIRSISTWFDAFIVLTSGVDYLFKFALSSSGGANLNFLRMARMIKVVKLFRAFKAAAAFSELRILMKTLVSSMMALTWSVVLLSFIMLFCGLVMCQLVANIIEDDSMDYEFRKWAYERYGSGTRSFYTLFEATLSGGWPNYARTLIELGGFYFAFFWVLYVMIVVFAVMRVVGALFLQNTLKMASADEEMMHMEKLKKKQAYIVKLKTFLHDSDKDGNGNMNFQELSTVLKRDDIQSWLEAIGLEPHEVCGLFHVLDDGHGEITHTELLEGMMKLSGGVRAIDSVVIQRDIKRVLIRADRIITQLTA